jgi:hypothetical protein
LQWCRLRFGHGWSCVAPVMHAHAHGAHVLCTLQAYSPPHAVNIFTRGHYYPLGMMSAYFDIYFTKHPGEV